MKAIALPKYGSPDVLQVIEKERLKNTRFLEALRAVEGLV